jgi:hypothetical protein
MTMLRDDINKIAHDINLDADRLHNRLLDRVEPDAYHDILRSLRGHVDSLKAIRDRVEQLEAHPDDLYLLCDERGQVIEWQQTIMLFRSKQAAMDKAEAIHRIAGNMPSFVNFDFDFSVIWIRRPNEEEAVARYDEWGWQEE